MQSGDPEILKAMRRRYNSELYRELIFKLTDEIKDAGIGADVITGFPGETEKQFENTFEFIESLPVSYLHVFSYSERKNTDAVMLQGKVDVRERRRRSELLRNLSDKKRFEFYSGFKGTYQDVLFESVKNDDFTEGLTTNYIRVKVKDTDSLENTIENVKLISTDGVKPVLAERINVNVYSDQ